MQVRHKATASLVCSGDILPFSESRFGSASDSNLIMQSSGKYKLAEASKYDPAEGEAQVLEAKEALRSEKKQKAGVLDFLNSGDSDIYFNGAGDPEIDDRLSTKSIEHAWSLSHNDHRYKRQNWETIDRVAEILRQYDQIMIEIKGETGTAEHAPEKLAAYFGLNRTRDVKRIMDRLAEMRAEACKQALILRGIAPERLFVTFKGKSGNVRTNFIPRSMHNSTDLAKGVTSLFEFINKDLVFPNATDPKLLPLSQAWAIEHSTPKIRLKNRETLKSIADRMRDYPMLHLEVHVAVQSALASDRDTPRRLLAHFPGAAHAMLEAEIPRAFRRYDHNKSGDLDVLELADALRDLGVQTDSSQAKNVLDRYDSNRSGLLELNEFTTLVHELRRFQADFGSATDAPKENAGPASAAQASIEAHAAFEQLAKARLEALLTAFVQLGLPSSRIYGRFAVGAPSDTITFKACTPDERKQVTDASHDNVLHDDNRASAHIVTVGQEERLTATLHGVSATQPKLSGVTATVRLDTKDALYADERYLLECVAAPHLGVPYSTVEFVMPPRHEKLDMEIDRARGHCIFVLVDSRAGVPDHWTAALPLPSNANLRVRHKTWGIVATLDGKESLHAHRELKDTLFVGEEYSLELYDSPMLEPTSKTFVVEYLDRQTVKLEVSRRWRDVTVALKYLADEIEPFPYDIREETVTIALKHKTVATVTTTGIARNGLADLPGADAVYVGMTYRVELQNADHVTARPTEFTVKPPLITNVDHGMEVPPQLVELPVHAATGMVKIQLRNLLHASGYPLESLPLPPITFDIFPTPKRTQPKASGTTDADGRYTLNAGAQLYVGRTYTLEVNKSDNRYQIENASIEFTVVKGVQTVNLDVQRATGDVSAIFTTLHANTNHWARGLKLPSPFEYRIVHRKLGVTAYSAELGGLDEKWMDTMRTNLPSAHTLFVGEEYTIEVGYQV